MVLRIVNGRSPSRRQRRIVETPTPTFSAATPIGTSPLFKVPVLVIALIIVVEPKRAHATPVAGYAAHVTQLSNGSAHLAIVDACEREQEQLVRATDNAPQTEPPLHVKLSPLDRIALDGLTDPRDVPALIAWTESSATALAGSDREGARLRLISRSLATERARLLVLEGMLDERLAAGDWDAVREIRPVIATASKTLCGLLREHAAACHVGRHGITVAVAHVDAINVAPGK